MQLALASYLVLVELVKLSLWLPGNPDTDKRTFGERPSSSGSLKRHGRTVVKEICLRHMVSAHDSRVTAARAGKLVVTNGATDAI